MDLPQYLEKQSFVEGKEELQQTIRLLLQESKGSFLTDYDFGSDLSVHVPNMPVLDSMVVDALSPINGLTVESVFWADEDHVQVRYSYNGVVDNFVFNLQD